MTLLIRYGNIINWCSKLQQLSFLNERHTKEYLTEDSIENKILLGRPIIGVIHSERNFKIRPINSKIFESGLIISNPIQG